MLPKPSRKGQIVVRFEDDERSFTWQLSKDSVVAILYVLANRATRAAYCFFKLRLHKPDCSWTIIENNTVQLLASIVGLDTGYITIFCADPHERSNLLANVTDEFSALLPQDAPILSLLSYGHGLGFWRLTGVVLWYPSFKVVISTTERVCFRTGLTYSGDGVRSGKIMKNQERIEQGEVDYEDRKCT